jgi:3'-phosphoadenosine 5'-phosphosulfate sulfotransferase (PAPS reductase)/FAD synthetase
MNIVNCSLGKDSTAMLLMMLERGIPVDRILYADVGEMAEFEQIYDYLPKVEAYTGKTIETVRSDRWTARSIFYGYPTRGKHMDEIRGFPLTIGSACRYRTWLKVEPLERAAGQGQDIFIGIAADESGRSRCKEYTKGKNRYHFPLVEWGVTEQQCLDYIRSKGLYNPLYDFFRRLGCFWCPKQPLDSLRQLYRHFPDQWAALRQMEADQKRPFQYKRTVADLELRFQRELQNQCRKQGVV